MKQWDIGVVRLYFEYSKHKHRGDSRQINCLARPWITTQIVTAKQAIHHLLLFNCMFNINIFLLRILPIPLILSPCRRSGTMCKTQIYIHYAAWKLSMKIMQSVCLKFLMFDKWSRKSSVWVDIDEMQQYTNRPFHGVFTNISLSVFEVMHYFIASGE